MIDKTDPRRGWTSASDALPDSLCPARHLAQKGIPHTKKSADSELGRKVHEILSMADPNDWVNIPIFIREIAEKCRGIERKKLEEFFGIHDPPIPKAIRERADGSTRLWAKIPAEQAGKFYYHSGQPDVIHVLKERAIIIEYKTLAGDVPESSENLQLRDQAVLFKGANPGVKEIGTVVDQPMVDMDPKICLYSEDSLKRAEREMFDRVRASNNPASKPIPGPVQCEHCLAKNSCIAYHQWAGSMVPAMLSVLEVPIAAWTKEQMVGFLKNRRIAQKWLDNCMEQIESLLESNPNAIPGYGLKPGAVREIITNPQLVFERFVGIGGKTEDFLKCISVKKSGLREAVFKTTGAKGNALNEAIDTLTKDAIQKKQNKASVVELANDVVQEVEDQ